MGSQEQFKGKLYLLSNHRWKIFSNQLYRNVMFIFRIWQLVIEILVYMGAFDESYHKILTCGIVH